MSHRIQYPTKVSSEKNVTYHELRAYLGQNNPVAQKNLFIPILCAKMYRVNKAFIWYNFRATLSWPPSPEIVYNVLFKWLLTSSNKLFLLQNFIASIFPFFYCTSTRRWENLWIHLTWEKMHLLSNLRKKKLFHQYSEQK